MRNFQTAARCSLYQLVYALTLNVLLYTQRFKPGYKLLFHWQRYTGALLDLLDLTVLGLCYELKEPERDLKIKTLQSALRAALKVQLNLRRLVETQAQCEQEWYAEQLSNLREYLKDLAEYIKWLTKQPC